jgi:hypothetical protein
LAVFLAEDVLEASVLARGAATSCDSFCLKPRKEKMKSNLQLPNSNSKLEQEQHLKNVLHKNRKNSGDSVITGEKNMIKNNDKPPSIQLSRDS